MGITPTSPKEPTLCYTLDKILILTKHGHGKKNYQFQNFTRINQTFADEEEDYNNEYMDYCENVTMNEGQDGGALLAKYFKILHQFNKILEIEKGKKAEKKKKKKK